MTVYLVTCGEYEHYHVEGAFSSRRKAQPYADYLIAKGESAVEIERLKLDVKKPKPTKRLFCCQLIPYFEGQLIQDSQLVDADEPVKDSTDFFYSCKSAQEALMKAIQRRNEYLRDNPNHGTSERDWRSDLTTC